MAEEKNETSPSGDEKPVEEQKDNSKKEETKDDKKVEENGDEKPKENGEEKPSPEPVKDMRAIVLSGFGGLKSVKSLRKPEPSVAEGEVLIRVKACGLSFQDVVARVGAIDSPPKTPFIMGSECAGDVEQVGEGVENIKVGDRVVALPDFKGWAELVTVPATSVYVLPQGMSYQEAVAITLNYTLAYIMLFELAALTPGKSLLLQSAGGGVGQAVVQLARTVKDVTIFGVCGKSKHETLKGNGQIDHLLERGSDYSSEVRKVSAEGVDIVLDCLCAEECNKGYALLKPMGRYVVYGTNNVPSDTKGILGAAKVWWQVDKISPIKLFDENKTVSGLNIRHLLYQQKCHGLVKRTVDQVFQLFQEGKIKPTIDSTWALEDVTEAMQKLHERKNIGKIVLDPSLEPRPKPATPAKGKSKDKKSAIQEDKKAASVESNEDSEKKKEPELTNGTSEDKSDSDSTKEATENSAKK